MRRSDREITDRKTMIEIIKKCQVCRLAIMDEPVPYILPLNFGMEELEDDIVLYFHGANEGKKYELIRKNNRVSFEMDCAHRLVATPENGTCTMEYESIIGDGYLEFVDDENKKHALDVLMKQYHKENFQYNAGVIPKTTVMKLKADHLTGKQRKTHR